MKIGPFDAQTVDDCLDILEASFGSGLWREVPKDERLRLFLR
jgi:hypothetical protein